jgi:hypothetical protein
MCINKNTSAFVTSDVDHPDVSVSVKGRYFNQTLGSEFCNNCRMYNYTYKVPLSKFMPDATLFLQFQ